MRKGAAQVLLLLAIIIWGWTFVASKICLQYMSPIELVAARFAIAAPALAVAARLRGVSLSLRRHRARALAGLAVFSFHYVLQTWALEFSSATNIGWIVATGPLAIALLAILFLKEPLTPSMVFGILLASLGVILLVSKGDILNLDWLSSIGDWMALASSFTWAIYTVVTRDVSREGDPLAVAFNMTLPLAALGVIAPFAFSDWTSAIELPLEGSIFFCTSSLSLPLCWRCPISESVLVWWMRLAAPWCLPESMWPSALADGPTSEGVSEARSALSLGLQYRCARWTRAPSLCRKDRAPLEAVRSNASRIAAPPP